MRFIFQGRLQTLFDKSQANAPNGLLTDIQYLADLSICFAFIHFQQDVRPLDNNCFVSTFRDDR
jgi:hypothetical protein